MGPFLGSLGALGGGGDLRARGAGAFLGAALVAVVFAFFAGGGAVSSPALRLWLAATEEVFDAAGAAAVFLGAALAAGLRAAVVLVAALGAAAPAVFLPDALCVVGAGEDFNAFLAAAAFLGAEVSIQTSSVRVQWVGFGGWDLLGSGLVTLALVLALGFAAGAVMVDGFLGAILDGVCGCVWLYGSFMLALGVDADVWMRVCVQGWKVQWGECYRKSVEV